MVVLCYCLWLLATCRSDLPCHQLGNRYCRSIWHCKLPYLICRAIAHGKLDRKVTFKALGSRIIWRVGIFCRIQTTKFLNHSCSLGVNSTFASEKIPWVYKSEEVCALFKTVPNWSLTYDKFSLQPPIPICLWSILILYSHLCLERLHFGVTTKHLCEFLFHACHMPRLPCLIFLLWEEQPKGLERIEKIK